MLTEKISKAVEAAVMPKLQEFVINADRNARESQKEFLKQIGDVFEKFELDLKAQIMSDVNERLKEFDQKHLK